MLEFGAVGNPRAVAQTGIRSNDEFSWLFDRPDAGNLGLNLLENGLALGQFQAEVVGVSLIDIARYRHEAGQRQCLPSASVASGHLPFHNSGHLSLPAFN